MIHGKHKLKPHSAEFLQPFRPICSK